MDKRERPDIKGVVTEVIFTIDNQLHILKRHARSLGLKPADLKNVKKMQGELCALGRRHGAGVDGG